MDQKTEAYLKSKIRDVKDFPKPGIVFKDITALLLDPEAFKVLIDEMVEYCEDKEIDIIAGIESRGFILGSVIAHELNKGFVPIRKSGKLPADSLKEKYDLEYRSAEIEIHKDAVKKGQNVLIADDVLATGGTALAAAKLVEKLGGKPALLFFIELGFLKGREKLSKYQIYSLIKY